MERGPEAWFGGEKAQNWRKGASTLEGTHWDERAFKRWRETRIDPLKGFYFSDA